MLLILQFELNKLKVQGVKRYSLIVINDGSYKTVAAVMKRCFRENTKVNIGECLWN